MIKPINQLWVNRNLEIITFKILCRSKISDLKTRPEAGSDPPEAGNPCKIIEISRKKNENFKLSKKTSGSSKTDSVAETLFKNVSKR